MNNYLSPIAATGSSVPARGFSASRVEKELTIKDLLNVLWRRRGVLMGVAAAVLALGILFCVLSTRKYQARAEISVENSAADLLGVQSMMDGGESRESSDAVNQNVTLQTEANILQSDTLALKVINDLNLESTPDFHPMFNPIGWALGLVSPGGPGDPPHASLDDSPRRRTHALKVFSANLKVKPVTGTRLIEIEFLHSDQKMAAAVVNHLVEALSDYGYQSRFNATSQASKWLTSQMTDLRKESEALQARVVKLRRDAGVFTLGEEDGHEQSYSTVLDRLRMSTAELSQAQSNRILKGATYQVATSGDAELLSGLTGSSVAASSPGLSNSLELIQNLRMQEANIQGQLEELSGKFGPAYPKLGELSRHLTAVRGSIHAEVQRVTARAKNDFEIARHVEDNARRSFDEQHHQADSLNDKAIEYAMVRQEASQSRTLYENLLKRLKEAGIVEGLRSSNISVVEPGRIPAKPAKPNVLLFLAASLVGGVFLGCCSALLKDVMDGKVQSLPELESQLGVTPFGILPHHKMGPAMLSRPSPHRLLFNSIPALSSPGSPYVEALRALRTSLILSRETRAPQVILVTSSVAREGKSMLSLNLAILFAQQGKKVLLVDADLRRPVLQRKLGLSDKYGLSSILEAQNDATPEASGIVELKEVPGLFVLPTGPVPSQPAELLGSFRMAELLERWRGEFDQIILDSAPVLPVTDSVVLSGITDVTLLTVRHNFTERPSLERSLRLLHSQSGQSRVEVVINSVTHSEYENYGYQATGSQVDVKTSYGRA